MSVDHAELRARAEEAHRCKRCRQPTQIVEFRLDVVQFPWNPEWPLERIDAGRFCSDACLVEYLSDGPRHD